MLAIVYFIISAVFGICLVNLTVTDPRRLFVACAPSKKAIACIPNTLFTVPAGILVGLIVTGFFNYFVILGLSYFVSDGNLCKRIGVLITFAILIWLSLSIMIIINRRRLRKIEEDEQSEIPEYKYNIRDTLFFGIVAAILMAVMMLPCSSGVTLKEDDEKISLIEKYLKVYNWEEMENISL